MFFFSNVNFTEIISKIQNNFKIQIFSTYIYLSKKYMLKFTVTQSCAKLPLIINRTYENMQ